jgi:hypothetical protein
MDAVGVSNGEEEEEAASAEGKVVIARDVDRNVEAADVEGRAHSVGGSFESGSGTLVSSDTDSGPWSNTRPTKHASSSSRGDNGLPSPCTRWIERQLFGGVASWTSSWKDDSSEEPSAFL